MTAWITVSVMPYAAYTSQPKTSRALGTMRPKTPTRSDVVGRSGAMRVDMQKGMREKWVIRWRATTSQNRLDDHFGTRTAVAPIPKTGSRDHVCAFTWKNGVYTR